MAGQSTDLRVRRTREAIRKAFQDMVCTLDYKDITVREIAERARINRKTFYLHYPTIDDLLAEFRQEVIDYILSENIVCNNLADIRQMSIAFFDFVSHLPLFHERLICHPSYRFIGEQINLAFIGHLRERERGHLFPDEGVEDILFTFIGMTAFNLYRHWVNDGKRIPLEQVKGIELRLITGGLEDILGNSTK